jgi:RHS repeat-associated protein
MFLKNKMGCLKLSYGEKNYTGLKVVYSSLYENENSCAGSYRFGFNGQEKIDEVYGENNYLDFTYRGYNPRLGRFFAVDPLAPSYPMLTPYQFASNTPIWARELEGLEAWYTNEGNATSDEFGTGPQNPASGPMTDEHATDLGYTQYGLNETVKDYSFSNTEVKDFASWNAQKGPTEPGACIGCAVTGAEKLTGGDAGFRNSKGKNVLSGKTLYDVGTNMENAGNASELPTEMNQETTTILNNPNAASTENTAYILGPAGAYHSILMIHNTSGNTYSIFDQGTGWDVKNATKLGAQSQISSINSIHPTWGSRIWQLNKTSKIEVKYPIGK